MSQKAIAALWISQGGNPRKADEYSAIMMPESGGDTKIYNGICCYGLAQLNVRDGIASKACAESARCSVRKSIELSSNGTNWTPWQAYTEGKHKAYIGKSGIKGDENPSVLEKALASGLGSLPGGGSFLGAVAGTLTSDGGPGLPNIDSPLDGINQVGASLESIARLMENLFTAHFWVRFGKGLLGALLLVYALQGLLKATLGVEIPLAKAANALK